MTRWWDSGEALKTLELVDGHRPDMGVGVAVLGYHAIAKSALLPLAERTLVDVAQVEAALDRADFAPVEEALHSALCESMGHDASCRYAELVVKDLTTRSKEAAGRLTRTLVNKGLPWPRAVSRAAQVAGVPIERLGRYATQAATPGLDPLSVADQADRVLMEYAQSRAAMESGWVSKAEGRMRVKHRMRQRQEFNEAEVTRDELGRFAEEGVVDLDARRARMQERQERRARKERMTARETQEVSQPGPRNETPRGEARGEKRGVSRGTTRGEQRQRKGGGSSVLPGYELVRTEDLPVFDGPNVPFRVVDEPLYVIELTRAEGFAVPLPYAYTRKNATRAVARAIVDEKLKPDAVTVWEFPRGGLPVRGTMSQTSEHGHLKGSETLLPMPIWETKSASRAPLVAVFDDNSVLSRRWVQGRDLSGSIQVVTKPAWMAPVDDKTPTAKADEGRQRMRSKKHVKLVFNEADVRRDELGRFAEEGVTADEIAARKERKKARDERRARKARMHQKQTETQVEETRQETKASPRGQLRATTRGVKRVEARSVKRQRLGGKDPLTEFVRPAAKTRTASVRYVDGQAFQRLGIGVDVYDPLDKRGVLLHEAANRLFKEFQRNNKGNMSAKRRGELQRMYAVSLNPMSDPELEFVNAMYEALKPIRRATNITNMDAQGGDFAEDLGDLLSELGGKMMEEAGSQAFENLKGAAPEFHSSESTSFAEYAHALDHQGALDPMSITPVVLMNVGAHPGTTVPEDADVEPQVLKNRIMTRPDRAVVVMSDDVARRLEQLYWLCAPGWTRNGMYTDQNAAYDALVKAHGERPLAQLVLEELADMDVRVKALDDQTKAEIAQRALPSARHGTVRLDGIDVLRIA